MEALARGLIAIFCGVFFLVGASHQVEISDSLAIFLFFCCVMMN
jgi:hypothetical protein